MPPDKRPQSRKRTLLPRMTRMVLLLLTGGAIINVAVAWGCALLICPDCDNARRGQRLILDERGEFVDWWHVTYLFRNGSHVVISTWASAISGPDDDWGDDPRRITPKWTRLTQYRDAGHWPPSLTRIVDARGFPLPSIWGESTPGNAMGAIPTAITGWTTRYYGGFTIPRVIPLRPLWPGFAINTIFYAAILWLLFAAPGKIRRIIRGRRGQCPACAYPIGASDVCTECGAVLPLPLGEGRGEGKAR